MMKAINLSDRPAPEVYSHAVEATGIGRILFVSGQVGVAADGSVASDVAGQAQQAAANLDAVLAEAGMSNANIAKCTIFLTDEANLGPFMQAAAGALPSPPPATTLVIVKALADPRLLVEIEAIAVG
ncbi:endoribonuclease L-PSP [Devosia geojensis]|uniref:Endoribonuclease L-PSP n=1 Tax=Devosia geojensis TaxID=443610 RepID=A0A0F5FWL6_9HYPH|nr:RidA family protein [Devosia geojensis]KKB13218.1 endoribonuclease L-PSP [Devosia geojensis]